MTSRYAVQSLLDCRVDEVREKHHIPGVAAIVFRGDGIVAATAKGLRSAEDPAPLTLDTLFRLHSVTKMVTAVTALRLRDRGLLDLDARLADVTPRLVEAAPELLGDLTVSHLLSHTSGLSDGSTDIGDYSRDPTDLTDLTEQVRRVAVGMMAIARPGRLYSYSNYGFSLVGAAIEEATGKPFFQVATDLVARPLGLASLCFDPLVAMTYPLSQHHPLVRGRLEVDHWYVGSVRLYPAAMAFMSPNDLCHLGRMYLRGGLVPGSGERFLSRYGIEDQRRRRADIGLIEDRHYGLGMYVGPRVGDADRVGHEGYYIGMWCSLVLYPAQDCGIVWCDNRGESRELSDHRREAMTAVCRELGVPSYHGERPIDRNVPDEAALIGTYTRTAARPIHVDKGDERLRLRLGGAAFSLTNHTGNVYRLDVPPELMGTRPLTPHAGSGTPSVAFHFEPRTGGSHLSINGLVYGRA